jgi:simple sugar transport system permease protein
MEVLLFVAAALRISVPYTLAAVGATFSERGGVINIGLEGMMLNGALGYVLGAYQTGNPWLGVLSAIVAGVLTAWLHAEVTVRFRADQITSGLGINLLAAGLTKFVLTQVFHSSSNSSRVVGLPDWNLFGLMNVPRLGPVLATPLVLVTIASVLVAQATLFRSVFGLRLRAIGEHPEKPPRRSDSPSPAIVSRCVYFRRARRPRGRLARERAALVHRLDDRRPRLHRDCRDDRRQVVAVRRRRHVPPVRRRGSPQITLQGSSFPSEVLQMLPYIVTMLVLAGLIGRSTAPRRLGSPYDPENA